MTMPYTVSDVISTILKEVPGAPLADTVDTLKAGQGDWPVTGIVTTFIATMDVLRRAVELGANLVITHEPTYFDHRDEVDWLAGDPVYAAKQAYIAGHRLAIWRFHDHWHMHRPDGIVTGLVDLLGWQAYADAAEPCLFHLPETTLGGLAEFFKARMGIPAVRVVGPPDMPVRRAAIMVGSYWGRAQIATLSQWGADVLACGECDEWQVYEYVRDANACGLPKGLIILGHERSEEPGMAYLASWLPERLPGVQVTHVPAGDPLTIR